MVEVLSASESELGGYREIICRLAGNGARGIAGTRRTGRAGEHEENGKFFHERIIPCPGRRSSVRTRTWCGIVPATPPGAAMRSERPIRKV